MAEHHRPAARRTTMERSPDRSAVQDESLMNDVAAGDREAIALLYDQYAAVVYGLAVCILGDRAVAVERTVATFAQIQAEAPSFAQANEPLTAWLVGLAHRTIVQGQPREDTGPGAHPAIAPLPSRERLAIESAYYAGHDYHHVADELQMTPQETLDAVRQGLWRLRGREGVGTESSRIERGE